MVGNQKKIDCVKTCRNKNPKVSFVRKTTGRSISTHLASVLFAYSIGNNYCNTQDTIKKPRKTYNTETKYLNLY